MKEIILNVLDFIKNPKDQRIENLTFRKNIKYILYILFFELIVYAIIYFPLIYFINKVEPILYETRIDYKSNSLTQTLIITAIVVPIFEEIIFRLALKYNKIFALFLNRSNWNFIFKFLVYFSILAFGFVHSSNFENNSTLFYCVLPILISTQLIGGVFLTFLRVKFNFISSVIIHILWNSIFTIIPLIISVFEKPYEKVTENYTLKIEYVNYNTANSQKFEIDSASNKILKAEINEYSLNDILDSLYHFKRKNEDHLLNIKLESKKGLSKEEFKTLLLEYDKNELQ